MRNPAARAAIFSSLLAVMGQVGCGSSELPPPGSAAGVQPGDANRLLQLGLAFHRAGDTLRAEQYLSQALEQGADPNVAVPALVRVCMQGNRLEAAALHAEDYIEIVKGKDQLQLLLAGLYVTLHRSPQALTHLQSLVARDPRNSTAHLLLARLLKDEMQDYAGADRHFRRYLELEPQGSDAVEASASVMADVSSRGPQ